MGNKFLVSTQGKDIVFLRPVPPRMTKEDALILAAWIVAIADPHEEQFWKAFEEVVFEGSL